MSLSHEYLSPLLTYYDTNANINDIIYDITKDLLIKHHKDLLIKKTRKIRPPQQAGVAGGRQTEERDRETERQELGWRSPIDQLSML